MELADFSVSEAEDLWVVRVQVPSSAPIYLCFISYQILIKFTLKGPSFYKSWFFFYFYIFYPFHVNFNLACYFICAIHPCF